MLTFNLKKEWFEKIKSGEKTHEFREYNPYWIARINNFLKKNNYAFPMKCCFACGYPNKLDKDKFLYAYVTNVQLVNGLNTDLKINKIVFNIWFELIEEKI